MLSNHSNKDRKGVLHFVRKESQLKSSFIQNQILNHIDFEPAVIFRQKKPGIGYDGGLADEISEHIKVINIGGDETEFEKKLFRFGSG